MQGQNRMEMTKSVHAGGIRSMDRLIGYDGISVSYKRTFNSIRTFYWLIELSHTELSLVVALNVDVIQSENN